ncbi:adenylosuccinate lyase [Agriterribacter sp.]|uniref:adenylosuccinate lyase n=1 Tax=Agriterribacter sp. TaxID=2821509 RepID=UPI002B71A9AF|nr:adenylosuccinate lyase [Agriterribacter sp.]HRO46019.1 adenylosuccinate lyase [Agriterribacter sp.]HRQ17055.1 adenylosuccinate lyase [Agriterribacter sp.]
MDLSALTAISPVDGRYRNQVHHLDQYFSEFALIRYRILVEIEYFIALSQKKYFALKPAQVKALKAIYQHFTTSKATEIKNIEKITNHDVKAVEYYIKQELDALKLGHLKEWIHFGLTSQDVNNTAVPLLWKESLENEYYPAIATLILRIKKLAATWKNIPMLARTHGQPASPTRLGKEFMVFAERLSQQLQLLQSIPYSCKFGGATGNFNAHHVAYPKTDWIKFANDFCSNSLGLQRQQFTTQIEHYDHIAAHFDGIKRINTILIDFCRDIWTYISLEYFKQKVKKGEIGSSAMPHKVNPIDFENAEGNLGMAIALLEHLSAKLPVSRLQRDLTDSTVLRNIGVPFAHTMLALKSFDKGLGKLLLNETKIKHDLDQNWAVVAEAIQTILRREHYPNPYEALKELTRGAADMNQKTMHGFIDSLKISSSLKKELKAITPLNYTGVNPDF